MNIVKRLPLLTASLLIMGCGGTTTIISNKTNSFGAVTSFSSNGIVNSFKKCDGTIIYRINVKEERDPTIYCDITVNSGSLKLTLISMSDEAGEYISFTESQKFEFGVGESGNYKIQIEHNGFAGSYKIKWNQKLNS